MVAPGIASQVRGRTLLRLSAAWLLFQVLSLQSGFPVEPSIVGRGPHHRVVQTLSSNVTPWGRVYALTNRYVELATGMHYWHDGQWVESREIVEAVPGGVTDPADPYPDNPALPALRLGYWRFNTNTFVGEQGQLPNGSYALQSVSSWSTNAVFVPTNGWLRYREIETNGQANINCGQVTSAVGQARE
jgi:hypothetical protein